MTPSASNSAQISPLLDEMQINRTEPIDSSGDVILVLNEGRIRVSSVMLSAASPVFAAMLKPVFREGMQPRSYSSPTEVELPEDDFEPMLQICQLAHFKPSRLSNPNSRIQSADILRFAILAQKYQVSASMRLQVNGVLLEWFELGGRKASAMDLFEIAAAALIFDLAPAFARATGLLVRDKTESFAKFISENLVDLPVAVIVAVEEKRSIARHAITHELPALGKAQGCCGAIASMSSALQHRFDLESKMWPPDFTETSLTYAITTIRYTGDVHLMPHVCSHFAAKTIKSDQFTALADSILRQCGGVCLTCVKEGKTDLADLCLDH